MANPRDLLPPEILDALRRGQAAEVVRRLREVAGRGIRVAKERSDARLPGFPTATLPPNPLRALPPDAARALARGNKIEAIKLARQETGIGLKEAKDWVEAHQPQPHMPTGLAPGEVPRPWGGWPWVALLVAVIVAGLWLLR